MCGTDVKKMSSAQIKEELRKLYAVTDFADCLELSDLQKKLAGVRDQVPITHGLQYGPLLQIGNKTNPTGLVTLAHGLGDSADGWRDVGLHLAQQLPYLLFLLPTAAQRPVTLNGGYSMNAWYDIGSPITAALKEDRYGAPGVLQSVDYLQSLAHIFTKRLAMSPGRVVYAGFSQGGSISLAAGLLAAVAPAGVADLSGHLAGAAEVIPRVVNKQIPIEIFQGRQDTIVPYAASQATKSLIETECGVTTPIVLHEYDMEHSANPKEISDIAEFIKRVLPPQ